MKISGSFSPGAIVCGLTTMNVRVWFEEVMLVRPGAATSAGHEALAL
jgi:hypothetical protein